VHVSQFKIKIDRRRLWLPHNWPNCKKCLEKNIGSTPETPNQRRNWYQMIPNPKIGQERNRWSVVSSILQPRRHNWLSWWIMSRLRRLSFVGSLSQRRRQAKTVTFKGTSLCQVKFDGAKWIGCSIVVNIW